MKNIVYCNKKIYSSNYINFVIVVVKIIINIVSFLFFCIKIGKHSTYPLRRIGKNPRVKFLLD